MKTRKINQYLGTSVIRNVAKQLINRQNGHRLSDYARKMGKASGKQFTKSAALNVLRRLQREGRLVYKFRGSKVVGSLCCEL